MAALWMKFPDEVLLSHEFTAKTREALEEVFSNSSPDSAWRQALTLLGMQAPQGEKPMIAWHKNKPYFNWSSYTSIISEGSITLGKSEGGTYTQAFRYRFKCIFGLLKIQWKVARFMAHPPKEIDRLVESIALGLALQVMIIRLGSDQHKMADWLASSDKAPEKYHGIIKQIQAIQVRRTEISDVWYERFALSGVLEENIEALPEYFWDDEKPQSALEPEVFDQNAGKWKGKSVCAGFITGVAIVADKGFDLKQIKAIKEEKNAPLVLVFRSARPETTELFEYASAVLFSNGGILSHACTVAREMGIPCVTALGAGFFKVVKEVVEKEQGYCWLQVDAGEATVERF